MKELKLIADELEKFKKKGIAVLWRPFHEMNGDWFWWGQTDPQSFKNFWARLYRYLKCDRQLDNLIWVYSPSSKDHSGIADVLQYYPGDEYVDIVALDKYLDTTRTDWDTKIILNGYDELVTTKKPFGLGEFGPSSSSCPETCQKDSNGYCYQTTCCPSSDFDYVKLLNILDSKYEKTAFFQAWDCQWSIIKNDYQAQNFMNHHQLITRDELF
jgi:mannan endo-1,4-beta-mannosidase